MPTDQASGRGLPRSPVFAYFVWDASPAGRRLPSCRRGLREPDVDADVFLPKISKLVTAAV
jgi:hypothetical protein